MCSCPNAQHTTYSAVGTSIPVRIPQTDLGVAWEAYYTQVINLDELRLILQVFFKAVFPPSGADQKK